MRLPFPVVCIAASGPDSAAPWSDGLTPSVVDEGFYFAS